MLLGHAESRRAESSCSPPRNRGANGCSGSPGASSAGVLFALLASPVLVTFIDTLAGSYTSYNAPSAYQIQPELLLGFFDEGLLSSALTARCCSTRQ